MRFLKKEFDFIARYEKRGNSYRLKVYDGYKADGSQNIKTRTWKPSAGMTEKQIQKELERQLVLFEEEVKCGNGKIEEYLRNNTDYTPLSDMR